MLVNLRRLTAVCLLGMLAGCAQGNFLRFGKDDFPKAGPKNPVVQILALWQPGEGIGLDDMSTRGFSGQVYFLTGQSSLPATVQGEVRVYLFDDQGEPEEQSKPIHQFNFTAEAWDTHRYEGKLGPVYNVFIPYTRKGNHQTDCSLRVRFVPKEGPIVTSEMVNLMLGGTKPLNDPTTVIGGGDDRSGEQPAVGEIDVARDSRSKRISRGPAAPAIRPPAIRARTSADFATITPERPQPRPLTAAERERIIAEALRLRSQSASISEPARHDFDADGGEEEETFDPPAGSRHPLLNRADIEE